ncbi:hypothetical protein AAG570_002372 [Ranatra chinensis]|uniref:Cytochrome P450 n=1 Tax=Ranatra chinensis TaxID=642074 RepID=A0ABD0Y7B8_9HEMI
MRQFFIIKQIIFFIKYICHFILFQDKVVDELNEIFGDSDRSVDLKDIQQMQYMEKVIKESLRYFPPVPLISRTITEDLILGDGTLIPPGVHLIIPTYVIHRQPHVFPEPKKFDPERFSEENMKGRHPLSYIPFSAGPRNCIGMFIL